MINLAMRVSRYLVANILSNALLHLAMGMKLTPIWMRVWFIDPFSWIGAVILVWGRWFVTVRIHEIDVRDHG